MADTAVRSSSSNSGATGTAISVTAPAGTAEGDLVVVVIHINGQTTIADNNGGTPFAEDLADFAPNVGAGMTISVFSRRIQAADPGTYNFTGGASDRWSIIAHAISDPNPSDVYDVPIATANTDAPGAGSATIPSSTTKTNKSIHIAVGAIDGGNTLTTDPAGYTAGQSTTNQALRSATKQITPAGATGSQTMTASLTDAVIGLSIVIRGKEGTIGSMMPADSFAAQGLGSILRE